MSTNGAASLDLVYSIADQNVATTKSIGIYNFSVQLLQHLATRRDLEKLTVFTNRTIAADVAPSPQVHIEEHNSAVRHRVGRMLWDQFGVCRRAEATKQRWLLLPKGFCSFMLRPQMRLAAFVHDIMGQYYYRRYPGFWPRLESLYFSQSLAATIERTDVIFTNTNFTKSEVLRLARRHGLAEPKKIVVTGYGFDPVEPAPVGKENRILLFASNMPHKRTDIAIRFLKHWLEATRFDGVIDCIGILSGDMEKPQGPHWNWIGRVPPAKGREMIRQARAVVYVSEYEGFGMPPVEAVLEGTCPVFSGIPPIREVMGDAGWPFSNESPDSFVEAMEKAFTTSPETIREWSQALIARHNWDAVTGRIVGELSAA